MEYYEHNGGLAYEMNYEDDRLNGEYKQYYFGKLIESGQYKSGAKVGHWIHYDSYGSISSEWDY